MASTIQEDLFSSPKDFETENNFLFSIKEDTVEGYQNRTKINAQSSDCTLAFALDFSTAGERLTKKYAGSTLVEVPWGTSCDSFLEEALKKISKLELLKSVGLKINIAGNGIYTFKKVALQQEVNQWVYDCLKALNAKHTISFIRSGGQTGADTAGLVAGVKLMIPTLGLYPKGYKVRNKEGIDKCLPPEQLETWIKLQATKLI